MGLCPHATQGRGLRTAVTVEQRGGHLGIAEHAGPFAEGYRPEYGARELKRQIRSIVETRLARAMLGGEVTQGDAIRVGWDATAEQLRIEPVGKAASKTQNVSGAKETKARRRNPARPERASRAPNNPKSDRIRAKLGAHPGGNTILSFPRNMLGMLSN